MVRRWFPGVPAFLCCLTLLTGCTANPDPAVQNGPSQTDSSQTETVPTQPLSTDPTERPNILLIVVDDMGFSDLGSFGGEIETPNLDALALNGIRLTDFQTAPTCSPTRAMLLTGVDNHQAGLGNMAEEVAPNQQGKPGYEGVLNNRVVTVASLLRDAGYHTYMAGKWHLGMTEETSPAARGFERSFAMLSGGASHFGDMKPAYAPNPDAKAPYARNGQRLQALPQNFRYSTEFYVDELLSYLEQDQASDKPFFAYLAFTAPHWPLQAPAAAIEKYRGKYDQGYDVLHQQRLAALMQMGLLAETAESSARPPKGREWDDLSDHQRAVEIRQMEIYAAMVDQIDVHSGRLFDYLRQKQEFDNTLVFFMSDNGAEGHDIDETWPADLFPKIRKVIDDSHDFSYNNMGALNSYVFQGPNWAWASQPMLKNFKGFVAEGGTRTAAFVHYPRGLAAGEISPSLVSVKDLAPTLLDFANVEHPAVYQDKAVQAMEGVSMRDAWRDPQNYQEPAERVLGMEMMGKRSIRKGRWKLTWTPEPYGRNRWQLFDLQTDLAEQRDLAEEQPQKLKDMQAHWHEYVESNQVVLPDWVSGY